ncbi:MAG TPA: DNA polymerase/3'-5' exonuclease PolX [Candidatus Binataceae bacterium]|nr:DNA polymerase/3'-5' exonuclease PolX [Candidatus Binataceae bacterium]
MQNHEIAKVLDEIADMLEVSEDNFFRVRAYRNAARTVRDHPEPLAAMTPEQLRHLPGIGADLAAKLHELLTSGDLELHRELSSRISPGLVALLRLPALGPKRVRMLSEQLQIRNVADLKRAIESGALRSLRGFGAKMEQQLAAALEEPAAATPSRLMYALAAQTAQALVEYLRALPTLSEVTVAGSFRRRRDTVGDLDLLALSDQPLAVMDRFVHFPGIKQILGQGETKTSLVLSSGLQVDLRVVPAASYGAALIYFTGSQAHCVHLRRLAQSKGLLLNEYGLFRGHTPVAAASEEEVYLALGLPWIAPELREDRGEIEAAQAGRLPHLIARGDLRGDLHSHSTYTDGRASIEEMARRARELGLEYLAVTDHSRRLAMAHGLDPARLREQGREIERVQRHLNGLRLLRGIEVDIMEDGNLDLPDEALEELDWVVASVHYKLNQPAAQMTARLIGAIRNPHVDVIGHPSGRLLSGRDPSDFDLAEVLRVAREEGCALEVNSQAERLDLTDNACIAAKQAGVKLVISSDSHHPRDFSMLELGVNQARRGWLEPGDVLNTRPLERLRQRQ